MVDDTATRCIESCFAASDAAADAASHCLRWGGDHALPERINALVTCSAVTRMIAERLQGPTGTDASLLVLGLDVCRSAGRVCTELDDAELRPCQLATSAAAEALRALQARA
jgi:hypothetical protein